MTTRPIVKSQRPLSPHAMIYKWPITAIMSITHRATGIALYVGTLLVALWLIAAASSEETFATVNGLFGSWIGRIVLFGYTWALMHHMYGGIRHFIWDMGAALEKNTTTKLAWLTLIASVVSTVLIWVVALSLR